MQFGELNKLNEQKIFLIDAIGALFSVLFLLILYKFEKTLGMPKSVLITFICIALIFTIYSTIIHLLKPSNWKLYLTIIAILNIAYCLFTIYSISKNTDTITQFGYIYFIAEIIIILILATYELKLTRKTTNR